jgi:hypothetical protein
MQRSLSAIDLVRLAARVIARRGARARHPAASAARRFVVVSTRGEILRRRRAPAPVFSFVPDFFHRDLRRRLASTVAHRHSPFPFDRAR